MPSGIYNHKKTRTPIYTSERNKKISIARKNQPLSETHCRKIGEAHRGVKRKPFSKETRKKMSECRKGEKSSFWKGGISLMNNKIRTSLEYRFWREAVFRRDNWTCVWCGVRGGIIHADHIKPFSLYPELRFALDNGRTLCVPCHKTTDTYGNRNKNNHTSTIPQKP